MYNLYRSIRQIIIATKIDVGPHTHVSNLLIFFFLCLSITTFSQEPIDKKATKKTKALYVNLKSIAERGIMFGHQEDQAYGIQWSAVKGRSDVKDICGAYPAVHGWDVGKEGEERNLDGVLYRDMKKWIKNSFKRGGVNTISWHADNPVSSGNTWDTTRAVTHILPGGKDHQKYVERLDKVAAFLHSCRVGFTKVPIIFRPFHEHNGNWFWWGKGHCTEEEYIALWRFTVSYLRDQKNLHHVLYAFSPDRSRMDINVGTSSYLYGYPGDDYVDVLGFDNYMDVGIQWNTKPLEQQQEDLIRGLAIVSQVAIEKNKVAAFTETGLEGVTLSTWYTQMILQPLKSNNQIKLAYMMVWRNANEKHHYAPYPGHHAVPDFIQFYKDEYTFFENDIPNLYRSTRELTR